MISFLDYFKEQTAGFNIPRSEMPQLPNTDELLSFLNSKGIEYSVEFIPTNMIKQTQIDIDQTKVDNIKNDIDNISNIKEIVLSDSYHIVDGHHRFYAMEQFNFETVPSVVINKSLSECLSLFTSW